MCTKFASFPVVHHMIHLVNTLAFILIIGIAHSQTYGTTVGVRLGNSPTYRTFGLTINQRVVKQVTLEGIIQTDFKYNSTAHLMIRRHQSLLSKRLNAYLGAGCSFGIEESEFRNEQNILIRTTNNGTVGVDLVAGLEFTLLKAHISVDYKPNLNLIGREPWYSGQVGISARTVVVTGSKQNKKRRKRNREQRKAERQELRNSGNKSSFKDWIKRRFTKDTSDDDF